MKRLIFVGVLVLAMSGLAIAQDFPKYEIFGGYSYLRADMNNLTSWIGSGDYYDSFSGISNGHGFEASFTYNVNSWFGIKGDFSAHMATVDMDAEDVYEYSYPDEYYDDYQRTYETSGSAKVTQYNYLFGPEFSYRGFDKFRPFAHVLFGITQVDTHKIDIEQSYLWEYTYDGSVYSTDYEETNYKGSIKSTSFAMAFGGGVDINVNENISLRLPQIDYVLPTFRELDVDVTRTYADYNGDMSPYYMNSEQIKGKMPSDVFHNVRVSAGIVFKF